MARITTRSRAKLSAASDGGSRDTAADSMEETSKKETEGPTSKECHDQVNTDRAEGEMKEEDGDQSYGHSDDDDAQYDIDDPLFEPLVLDSVKDEDDAEAEPRELREESKTELLCQPGVHSKSEPSATDMDTFNYNHYTTDEAAAECSDDVVKETAEVCFEDCDETPSQTELKINHYTTDEAAAECSDDVVKETAEVCFEDCDEKPNQAELKIVSEIKEDDDAENVADEAEMPFCVKTEDSGNDEVARTEQDDDVDADDEQMVLVINHQDLCPTTPLPEQKRIPESARGIIEQEVKTLIEKLLHDRCDASCSKSGIEMPTPTSEQELKAYGCNLCGVSIGHPGRFEIHSNSRKHLQYLRWVNGINLNKEQGQFYCGVCRVSLPGKDVLSSHFRSDRHGCLSKLFNVDDYYATHVMERISTAGKATMSHQGTSQKTPGKLDDRSFTFKEETHTERPGVRSGLTPTSRLEPVPCAKQGSRKDVQVSTTTKGGPFHCDLCGVSVARQCFLQQHYNGKRHRTQVRLREKREAEQNFAQVKVSQGNPYSQDQLYTSDFDAEHWEEAPENPIQEQTEMSDSLGPESRQGDADYKVQGASEEEMEAKFVEDGERDQEYDEAQTGRNSEEDEARLHREEDEMMRVDYEYETAQGTDVRQGSEEDEQPTEETWSEAAAAGEVVQMVEDEDNENQENEDDEAVIISDVCIEEAEEDAPADDADEENAGVAEEPHVDTANAAPNEGTLDAVAESKNDEEKAAEKKQGKEKTEDKSRREAHHRHISSRDSHRHSRSDSRREPDKDSRRSSRDSRGRRHPASNSKDAKGSGADSKDKDARSTKGDSKDGAKDATKSESKTKSSTETKGEPKGDAKRDTKGDSKSDPKNDPKKRSSDTHHSHSRDRKGTSDSRGRRSPRDPKPRTTSSSSREPKTSSSTLRRRPSPVVRDAGRTVRRRAASPERSISSKKPKYSCFACKVAIYSDRDYAEHFDSRRHRQEVERKEKKEKEERAARRRSSSPRSYRRRDRSRSPVDRWRITAPLVTQPPHQAPDPSFVNAQWLNPAAFIPLQQQLQQHPQQHLAQLQQQQHLHQLAQAPQHIPHLQQPAQQQQCLPDVFGVAGALPQGAAPAAQALPLESYTERRPVVSGALDNMILLQQRLLTLASATGANAGATMPITQDYDAGLQARPPQQSDTAPHRPQERSMHQHQSSLRQGQQYKAASSYSQSKQNPAQPQVPFMEGSVSSRGHMLPEYNAGGSNSRINFRSSTADGSAHPYFSEKGSNSSSRGIPAQVTPRDSYNQAFQPSTTNPSSRYGNVLDASIGSKSQTRTDSQPSSLSRNQRSQYVRPGMNTMKAGDVDNSYQYMQKRF